MTESNEKSNINLSPKKDFLFWSKIIATQYLIRHPFWKSFALPMIIGQISASSQIDYTQSNYVIIVYILIAFHFLSGILISDRKFRHALGFIPHIIALGSTSYLFYSTILQQLTLWLKIRFVIHTLGTMAAFCFIASLHTNSIAFRSILRHLSSYMNVFYFILNAYVLWWSTDEIKFFNNSLWNILIRIHGILYFFVSGGFCLNIFLFQASQFALYLICSSIFLDICILYEYRLSMEKFWILLDYIIDDLSMLCGYFYFYQFHLNQKKMKMKKN